MRATALLAAACVLALAGCGAARPRGGAAIFASDCSGCHTLAPNPHPSPVGGTLAGYRMSEAQVESFTRVMPLRRRLSDAEVRAVARFVVDAQRQAGGGLRPLGR